MAVITEVLNDLYVFAVKYRFGFASTEKESEPPVLWSPIQPPAIVPPAPTKTLVKRTGDFFSANVVYVSIPGAFMYALPTRIFDGVLGELPYGAAFEIIGSQGKWLQIEHNQVRGWIHLDDVVRNKSNIEPQFTKGEIYTHDHADTVKLRTMIDDSFYASQFDLSLQDVEFVTYKLSVQNRTIPWPSERPRIAGTWQRILKGVKGVHLGVAPKTDAIMEYINADNTGHVAYVEAVYPDGSIFISEIGYPDEGRYEERTLNKKDWIELRPVFIEVI